MFLYEIKTQLVSLDEICKKFRALVAFRQLIHNKSRHNPELSADNVQYGHNCRTDDLLQLCNTIFVYFRAKGKDIPPWMTYIRQRGAGALYAQLFVPALKDYVDRANDMQKHLESLIKQYEDQQA